MREKTLSQHLPYLFERKYLPDFLKWFDVKPPYFAALEIIKEMPKPAPKKGTAIHFERQFPNI